MSLTIGCPAGRTSFAEYLDGRLTGREMQQVTAHLENCTHCAREFEAERSMAPIRPLVEALSWGGTVKRPSFQ